MRSSCSTDSPSMCLTSLWTWLSNSSRRWRRLSRWGRPSSWENQSKTLNPDIHIYQSALISTPLIRTSRLHVAALTKSSLNCRSQHTRNAFLCDVQRQPPKANIKLYLFEPNAVEHLSETPIFVLKAHRAKHIREDICYTSSHPSIRMCVDLYILYGLLLE